MSSYFSVFFVVVSFLGFSKKLAVGVPCVDLVGGLCENVAKYHIYKLFRYHILYFNEILFVISDISRPEKLKPDVTDNHKYGYTNQAFDAEGGEGTSSTVFFNNDRSAST